MQIVGKEQYDETARKVQKQNKENESVIAEDEEVSKNNIRTLMEEMENPVQAQKELAVRIKTFLDKHMEDEMQNDGVLSEFTRRWVKDFNDILDKIQKNLYGEKSLHLHSVRITHADISAKIRKRKEQDDKNSEA